ncbi:unnamed protein product, partial [Notodromas monacha]
YAVAGFLFTFFIISLLTLIAYILGQPRGVLESVIAFGGALFLLYSGIALSIALSSVSSLIGSGNPYCSMSIATIVFTFLGAILYMAHIGYLIHETRKRRSSRVPIHLATASIFFEQFLCEYRCQTGCLKVSEEFL